MTTGPADLSALDARERIARGTMTAEELVEACLARFATREPEVGAFTFLDPAQIRAGAKALDAQRASGGPTGPLHGLPVGVKDIVDTFDMPTENGTPLDAGRRPERDATLVARLRAAGALIMGKTVTTELASMHPRGTRNPHDPARTPGGSSSGSAAAVAAGMVPLAIGTQTNGSVIRPAAFCGIVGYKPTFGLIPRTGVLAQSRPLDTIGVFARSVADAALIADAITGHEPGDPDTRPAPPPRFLAAALGEPPATPVLAFVRTAAWEKAEPATREAFLRLAGFLGPACQEVALPDHYASAVPRLWTLALAGTARNYGHYHDRGRDQLSPFMREAIGKGRAVTAIDYLEALDGQQALAAGLDPIFDRFDAIITPAAAGEAPRGIDTTGDPVFCSTWTYCGVPAVTLPLLRGPSGLPLGVQVVGRRGDDARLLRTARWLERTVPAA